MKKSEMIERLFDTCDFIQNRCEVELMLDIAEEMGMSPPKRIVNGELYIAWEPEDED